MWADLESVIQSEVNWECAVKCTLNNTELIFLTGLSHSGPPSLIIWGPSTRLLGFAPVPQSPLKLFQLASRKPDSPPCLVFSTEATVKAPAVVAPFLLPPDQYWCSPMWPPEVESAPSLEICECNTLPFQWQLSPGVLISPPLNDSKAYICEALFMVLSGSPVTLLICLGRIAVLSWNELSGFFFLRKWLTFL